jgi:hypothetical protein
MVRADTHNDGMRDHTLAWVKIDDGFLRHPKIVAAGRDARDLYVAGLCYAGAQLTDGFIPTGVLRQLGADADIGDPTTAATRLVATGLWHAVDGGWRVHDYLDYQPSAKQVKAQRAASAARVAKWRAAHDTAPEPNPDSANTISNTITNGVSNASPLPSPSPTHPGPGIKKPPAVVAVAAAPPRPPRPDLRKPKDREKSATEQHPLFQAIVDLFGPPAGSRWGLYTNCLKDLDELGATVDDLHYRFKRYPAVMGKHRDGTPVVLSLPALVNNWHLCAPPAVNGRARAPTEPPPRSKAETAELRRRILAGEEIE